MDPHAKELPGVHDAQLAQQVFLDIARVELENLPVVFGVRLDMDRRALCHVPAELNGDLTRVLVPWRPLFHRTYLLSFCQTHGQAELRVHFQDIEFAAAMRKNGIGAQGFGGLAGPATVGGALAFLVSPRKLENDILRDLVTRLLEAIAFRGWQRTLRCSRRALTHCEGR